MNHPKTILFDGRFLSLSNAGLGRYSAELIKSLILKNNKEEFRYILLVMPGTKFDESLKEAIAKHQSEVEVIEFDAKHYSLSEQTKLRKLLNEINPDLVHFTNLNHPVFYKGKFVVTIHDLTLFQYSERAGLTKKLAYNFVINKAAQNSKKIFTVSEFAKKELIKKFNLPVNKVAVTYNGIDATFKKITNPTTLQKTEKYGLLKPYYLYVGQWRSHKNLLALVEAFSRLVKKGLRGKVELVFAGKIDKRYPQLEALVKKLNLASDVRFTGFVEDKDLPTIYNNALAFVFPSFSEGFGLPALEAQACGTPVISSDSTSLPEVLGDGAVYFDPDNINELEKRMIEVLQDEKLREKLIGKGLENAKKFTWDQTAEKTLEVYRELLYK
jgi:glycosyltransferase involved in cell wall biosynthesis